MTKRSSFKNHTLATLLLLPLLLILLIFFYWPSLQAIFTSLIVTDPFGLSYTFVGLENFRQLFQNPSYLRSIRVTLFFTVSVTLLTMALALLLAVFTDRVKRGRRVYQNLFVWPYARSSVVAGTLWLFLLDPNVGFVTNTVLKPLGLNWNPFNYGAHAMILIVIASVWNGTAYSFLFYFAALQSIPKELSEAAAIDGAGPNVRFWRITLPLLASTSFYLLMVNVISVFLGGFALVDALTGGGPAGATTLMIYKVYQDGFMAGDLGSSSAQSVILMIIVILFTLFQFRFVERRIHYN